MIQQILGSLLVAILIPVATAIGFLLAKLIRKGISKIDSEALQGMAWTAVHFVEQKFRDLHGKDKFDRAYEIVASKLPGVEKGNIEQAIESCVNAMNKEFPKGGGSSVGS